MPTATATKKNGAKKGKPRSFAAQMAVKFKTVPFGDTCVTLGFSVPKENCNVTFAEEAFCGKRVKVRIILGGADPTQGSLWDDITSDIEATVDIKKYSSTPKLISAGLCFHLESLGRQREELTYFAQKQGVLYVLKVLGSLQGETDEEEDDDDDDDDDDDGEDGDKAEKDKEEKDEE